MNKDLLAEIPPKAVREVLGTDNDGIIKLCKDSGVKLKKNKKGLTYFTFEDVKTLKKMSDIHSETIKYEQRTNDLTETVKQFPIPKEQSAENTSTQLIKEVLSENSISIVKELSNALKDFEEGVCDRFTDILDQKLEEKLGGIDDVIMELVSSKSDAEALRKEITKQQKEIYSLKNELSKYKKVMGNLYVRKEPPKTF